jgi:hypothetical protein
MLTPKPKSLEFKGTSADIAQSWDRKTARLTSGDLVVINPDGGMLQLESPLTVAGDITVTGAAARPPPAAPAPGGAPAGRRRLLAVQGGAVGAPKGAAVVACGKGTKTAFRVMSAGAVLRDLTVAGCGDAAVHLLPDPSQAAAGGRYPNDRPAQLEAVTLIGNAGAALRMDIGTAATVLGSAIERNAARGGAVVAAAGTLLNVTDSRLAMNNGSAVNFTGVALVLRGVNFTGNAAVDGAGLWSAFVDPPSALYVTKGTGTVVPPTGTLTVEGCRFEGNKAANGGGGAFVGARMAAFINGSLFKGNEAAEGGGVHAARDGCLESIDRTSFVLNRARSLGGGLLTRAPLCSDSNMTWSRLVFANNTAAGDGGGAYVSEAAYRWLRILGSRFAFNSAAGAAPPGRSGDGGGLYLGTWSSRVWLVGTTLAGNAAARSGGGAHAIMLSQDDQVDLTLTNSAAANNTAGASRGDPAGEGGALRVLGSFAALVVGNSSFERNAAGQGGAISFGADRGSVTVLPGTRFERNEAAVAGGALLVGESADASVSGALFSGNVAAAAPNASYREAAVGGGLCCYRCNSARVDGCEFRGNHAGMYGGGAALLRPFVGAKVTGSRFEGNTAALPALITSHRRRNLLAAAPPMTGECSGGECKSENRGYKLGAWATTVDVANTTADDGSYGGGGGLYLSLAGPINMSDTHFISNQAESGGECRGGVALT